VAHIDADAQAYGDAVTAELSQDGFHRFALGRRWGPGAPLNFVMLNPSTADDRHDDPTIRRCIGFAEREGFNAISVVNLFSWRATHPKDLVQAHQTGEALSGPVTDHWLCNVHRFAGASIAAWGAVPGPLRWRIAEVLGLLAPYTLHCLGETKHGDPRHPLMLPKKAPLRIFSAGARSELRVERLNLDVPW